MHLPTQHVDEKMPVATDVRLGSGEENQWQRIIATWSPEERQAREKKLLRKVDFRLLPILIIMYIMNYI
ncbi:hypothetical protein LTS18_000928, partial [Coniosporium uncinatum]